MVKSYRSRKYHAVKNFKKGWRGDSEGHRRAALGLKVPWSDRTQKQRERNVNLTLNLTEPEEQEQSDFQPRQFVEEPLPTISSPQPQRMETQFEENQEEGQPEVDNRLATPGVPPAPVLSEGFDIMGQ